MTDKKLGLSLKYKLLILLTLIPVVSLAIYIAIATRLFENDKIAYVKDSSVAVARSLAVQLRLEVNSFVEKIKPIVESFDYGGQQFTANSQVLFQKQDRLDALILIQKNSSGKYVQLGELHRQNEFGDKLIADQSLIEKIQNQSAQDEIVVSGAPFSDLHLLIGTRIGEQNRVDHLIIIGLYRAKELHNAFTKANIYRHFLLNKNKGVELGPRGIQYSADLFDGAYKSNLPEGALDIGGTTPMILSYADVGVSGLKVTAIADRKEALIAVNVLLTQSFLFFLALIATTIIISVFASVQMTSTLRELYEATKQIAQGKFDVRVASKSNDEVGGLADGFNFMAGEVSRLMIETSEKARMASELETVKLVQDTLFPAANSRFGNFHVTGHFEPASECGGDWWNYSLVGDRLFLWIGDATGHGAPAAMVTSAAKAAATIIEDLPFVGPAKALSIMNKAIHETTKGKILMTFFIGSIDLKTGEMVYANASHEQPYIVRSRPDGKALSKKDLEPLLDGNGPRLGDSLNATYTEAKVRFNPKDSIVFYTDGIIDLKNKDGKSWGERGFIKSICDSATKGNSVEQKVMHLREHISKYREDTALIDDITLFMCQYEDVA